MPLRRNVSFKDADKQTRNVQHWRLVDHRHNSLALRNFHVRHGDIPKNNVRKHHHRSVTRSRTDG